MMRMKMPMNLSTPLTCKFISFINGNAPFSVLNITSLFYIFRCNAAPPEMTVRSSARVQLPIRHPSIIFCAISWNTQIMFNQSGFRLTVCWIFCPGRQSDSGLRMIYRIAAISAGTAAPCSPNDENSTIDTEIFSFFH